ncbi:hypothetical protein OHB26_11615 [Nocardia sp. NBC_01503]|uniref:hypothetical protein n=1 Tax=Nocardia sp. NBC_01503 TaxID=2975997 RepID=UPI002E7C2268|nr:hypothetical protein [Nocardia sp. NBC_01503]WTL34780.1 hypothetical protein OHB26_11615 [Nocardia sp. NBC_01503]
MSHQLATQAAGSSRRAAQVLRYSAIVTAGMASIGLTVAAGSYIANQMAGTEKSGAVIAAPTAPHTPAALSGDTDPQTGSITPLADTIGLAAYFTPHPMETTMPQDIPGTLSQSRTEASPATERNPIAGQLRLGTAYLDAAVVPVQRNSISVTVDTNVFATMADLVLHTPLGETLGIGSDPSANTQLRTDVDTRSGAVTLTLSDPTLGRYDVRLDRHNTPGSTAV